LNTKEAIVLYQKLHEKEGINVYDNDNAMMKEQEQLVDDESISLLSIPKWDFIGTKIEDEDPIVGIVFETMSIMQ
jgi:hypothetical protein